MATYKGIKGVKVQSHASDPTASEAREQYGIIQLRTALKYAIVQAGAWASANSFK